MLISQIYFLKKKHTGMSNSHGALYLCTIETKVYFKPAKKAVLSRALLKFTKCRRQETLYEARPGPRGQGSPELLKTYLLTWFFIYLVQRWTHQGKTAGFPRVSERFSISCIKRFHRKCVNKGNISPSYLPKFKPITSSHKANCISEDIYCGDP